MNLKNISIILLLSTGASAFVPLESAFASKSQLVEEQSTEGRKIQPAAKQPSESAFPKEKEFVQYVLGLKKAHGHLDQPLEEYGVIISNAINFFKQKIDIEDERHGILSAMEKEANELAASKRLTLDHLNFYALKLMNISKADYKVKFNLFKGLAFFRELGDELEDIYPELTGDRLHPWKQSYATNIADNIVVGERLENHRKVLEEEQKDMTSKISNMILELNNVQNNADDYNLKNEQGRQLMEVAATALKRNHSNINDQIDIISAQIAKGASEIGLDLEIDHAYLVLRDKLLEAKTLNDTNVEQLLQEFEAFKKELDKNQSKFNADTKTRIDEAEASKLELGKMQIDLDTKTAEALKEVNEGIDANTQFRYNFLEVSKRGISVVPFFQERPVYSIETYIDLFIEGIYLVGAPTGDTCSVHESLFDDPASFYTHDLLHLQGLAPSTDERENKEHVNKMREVASVLWANIKKHTKQSKEYKEGKAALFALLHELSQYNTSRLLKATMTIQEAFSVMMQNARDNVTGIFLGDTVVDSDSYYRAVLLKNASFNRDASLNNLSPEIAVVETPEDILSQHAFTVTYKLGDFEGHYTSDDHLSKYENARKFAFPIACLLKGPGRYQNLTMDNFTLGAGYQKFTEFLNEFQKTYGTLNH